VIRLITNMHDEPYYLSSVKALVQRYTNRPDAPNAVNGLRDASASGGFTSALTVIFYAHYRPEARAAAKRSVLRDGAEQLRHRQQGGAAGRRLWLPADRCDQ
jgi:hypothetical protein